MSSSLTLGYLDDLTLGGEAQIVAADVALIEQKCSELGLHLNRSKCEVISHDVNLPSRHGPLSQFSHTGPETATLLGAPLSADEALETILETRIRELSLALERLGSILR